MEHPGSGHSLLRIRIRTLGSSHPQAHRAAVLSIVSRIASRANGAIWHAPEYYVSPPCCSSCHLLQFEIGTHMMARHDEQPRLLVGDLSKAALHSVLEPRPLGRHRERPDIRAISSHGGSALFDITFCHPLTPARIWDSVQNPLSIVKAAWSAKFARYASVLETYGTTVHLIPGANSTLGGWHPGSYRARGSVVSSITSRAISCLSAVRSILFQRHAAFAR